MIDSPVPRPRRLTDRRILPLWNGHGFDPLFVDDRGTCSTEQHPVSEGAAAPWRMFHRYRDEAGLWAVRCPASLTEAEDLRTINDSPPGTAAPILASRADERRGSKSKRNEGSDE